MAEYVFDESMKVVGADRSKMDIIQMDPEEGAAALVSGDVVMACLFGGNSIKAATAVGSRLLTVDEASSTVKSLDPTAVAALIELPPNKHAITTSPLTNAAAPSSGSI